VVPPTPITPTIFCDWEGSDIINLVAGNQQNLKGSVIAPMGAKVSYLSGVRGKEALDALTDRIIANPPNVVMDASGETHFSMALNSTTLAGRSRVWGI